MIIREANGVFVLYCVNTSVQPAHGQVFSWQRAELACEELNSFSLYQQCQSLVDPRWVQLMFAFSVPLMLHGEWEKIKIFLQIPQLMGELI